MATDQARKPREPHLTPEQTARVQAIRAKHRSPEARAEEARLREVLSREYQETGTLKTTGDGTTMGDLVEFRRFVMSLRRERERLGLSLADVAERAKIDKGALSRLENGQQLNPTINTLARYARAIGQNLACVLTEKAEDMPIGRATRYCSPEAIYTSEPYDIDPLGATCIFMFPDAPIYRYRSEEAPLPVKRGLHGFVVQPPPALEAIRSRQHTNSILPVINVGRWSEAHPGVLWGDSRPAPRKTRRRANEDLVNTLERLKPLIALYGQTKVKELVDLLGPQPKAPAPAEEPHRPGKGPGRRRQRP